MKNTTLEYMKTYNRVVCLTTVNTKVVCYETSENNLNLDQMQYITEKTRENGIPYGFVIPDVSAYFNYSYDNENTPPSKLTPHQNSFLYDYGEARTATYHHNRIQKRNHNQKMTMNQKTIRVHGII